MGECLIIKNGNSTDTSNATASADTIINGYSCYVKDELVIGNITICATSKNILHTSEMINLKHGYYSDENIISVSTLEEETVSTAVSSDMLINNSGWSNGNLLAGSMDQIKFDGPLSFSANDQYIIPQGWHGGTNTVSQSLSIQSSTNVTPSTSNKTVCSASKWTTGDLWVVGDSKLVAGNIKNGITIFNTMGTFKGWVDSSFLICQSNSGKYNYSVSTIYNWWSWNCKRLGAAASSPRTGFSKINISGGWWNNDCWSTLIVMYTDGTKTELYHDSSQLGRSANRYDFNWGDLSLTSSKTISYFELNTYSSNVQYGQDCLPYYTTVYLKK